ncbi:nitrate- and nitrite sensing domain-containing protein [Streptomyces sp. ACA25]|nr:nitrate- and nitrite sensing domain-containing protein [Streptomyces sp. ACA25]MDB1090421.1 nitrate- and nitrite sensing domain-containing protein [Streptomyces sp. ACA25]
MATKLNAILLIPVLVALVFAGLRVGTHYGTWQEAQDAERTAQLARSASAYAHALIDERDISARPLLDGNPDDPEVVRARQATDTARAAFDTQVLDTPGDRNLERRIAAVREAEPGIEALRQNAYSDEMQGAQTEESYVEIQRPLMTFANELGLGTGAAAYGRSIYAVSLGKSAGSLQRSIGTHLLVAPPDDETELARLRLAFTSYAYLENIAASEYETAAPDEQFAQFQGIMERAQASGATPSGVSLDQMRTLIASGQFNVDQLAAQGVTPEAWFQATTATFDAYSETEQELLDSAVAEAQEIASAARSDVIVNSVIVLTALLVAFFVAALMARSMSLNMRRLRTAAQSVAEERLPALVEQLSRTNPGEIDTHVKSISVTSRDEIGEVSRAFDEVHREAVRLAAEQALLRGNVNAIFTNLSSRNQGLIERQLGLITELENNEADPDQLESLFKLDHLATRMRRNGENLLVLAGEEAGRRWNQPVPLTDVVRAAASEVEDYERIELAGVPESEIHGAVVTDLVHLLAELLENATSFSSPHTKVRVTATRLPDGRVMVEIHDKGIGLTAEDFAQINHRLSEPPAVDAAISRRMGLFVVGRLAERHGIRVQLRPSGEQSGTTSLVMLPEAITQGGVGPQPAEEEFTVSRMVPEGPRPQETPEEAGLRTAAELGFDDSRYAAGDGPRELGPIGRTAHHEERRAQLEAEQVPPAPRDAQGFQEPQHQAQEYSHPGYGDHAYQEAVPGDRSAYGGGTYPEQGYGDGAYPEQRFPGETGSDQRFDAFPQRSESHPAAPPGGPGSVGFTGPGHPSEGRPAAAAQRASGAQPQWQQSAGEEPQRLREEPLEQAPDGGQWHRGPRREAAQPSGTTTSGLPKRVPRANLTEHPTEEPPKGGPQVSRNPEDVRGRLSDLHRGVRQGRDAGTSRARNDDPGFGPGNTYDQER